jgi:hypothetical protein
VAVIFRSPQPVRKKIARQLAAKRIREHLSQPYDKRTLYGGLSEIRKEIVVPGKLVNLVV